MGAHLFILTRQKDLTFSNIYVCSFKTSLYKYSCTTELIPLNETKIIQLLIYKRGSQCLQNILFGGNYLCI